MRAFTSFSLLAALAAQVNSAPEHHYRQRAYIKAAGEAQGEFAPPEVPRTLNLHKHDNPNAALLVIDMQYDFMPGGSLAVNEGDLLVPIVNDLIDTFNKHGQFVVATQDWHPRNHVSFASTHNAAPFSMITVAGQPQVLWPDHCVQHTHGARMHADLRPIDTVVLKGTDPHIDSYSGFFDNGGFKQTELNSILKDEGIDEVYVVGIATDYCVHHTAMDALKLGYKVNVIVDATRGVNSPEGSVAAVMSKWREVGINIVTVPEVLA